MSVERFGQVGQSFMYAWTGLSSQEDLLRRHSLLREEGKIIMTRGPGAGLKQSNQLSNQFYSLSWDLCTDASDYLHVLSGKCPTLGTLTIHVQPSQGGCNRGWR